MAYLSKLQVAEIRKEIAKVLTTKDGFKISVTRYHYSGVEVRVMQSPLAFSSAEKQINEFCIDRLENDLERLVFQLIDKAVDRAVGISYDRNAQDMGADYSNYNYYKNYAIGRYDKDCKFI
jgi:hypothetical protein